MSLLDHIISAESGGDANARNPRSSAAGLGQFIDSTWVDMLGRYRPDITGSREQLLALKTDPELSREMVARYAAENEKKLADAGFEATPGSVYLAHFAGPQGAVRALQASPDTPVASILGNAAVAANPFLKDMTAADLRAWAEKKVGGRQPQPAPAQKSPSAAPAQPLLTEMLLQQAAQAPLPYAPQAATQNPTYQASTSSYYEPQVPQDAAEMPPPTLVQSRAGPSRLAQQQRLTQLRAAFPMRPFYFGSST